MKPTDQLARTHLAPEPRDLARLLAGEHHDPHSILGAHEYGDHTVIRAFRPHATEVVALVGDDRFPLQHIDSGLFAVALPFVDLIDYRLEVSYHGSDRHTAADAYRFLPTLGEVDLHLFGEGRHERLWEVLGAHPRSFKTADGVVDGVSFAVWAPNAKGVSLIAEFNGWNGNDAPLRVLGSSGVWELFWPDFPTDGLYKFRVHGADGSVADRADPFAFATEVPPHTASRVNVSDYRWSDDGWMTARAQRNPVFEPMSTYEVHLGSWRPGLSYRDLARELTDYVVAHGFTHVEMLPVAEHPFAGSWGYQVTSYYAPTSRFGTPDEFRALVDALHQAGIGVIVDWVPAHFPKDAWALGRFDGTPLYEHSDPRRGEQLDWGTYVFDFGRAEVRNFLVANALYWLEEFHIDGLRVDAVASMLYLDYSRPAGGWTPNIYGGRENLEAVQFLQEMNATAHKAAPGIVTIAEESTSWPGVSRPTSVGGLGFSMKWNMGWMHDTLDYVGRDPVYRSYHHHAITFSMLYAFSENFVLPISHDEVVHGKGTLWDADAGQRPRQGGRAAQPAGLPVGAPGQAVAVHGSGIRAARRMVRAARPGLVPARRERFLQRDLAAGARPQHDLPRLPRRCGARTPRRTGYSWIDANDSANNVLSFLRYGSDGSVMACVFNFAGAEHSGYRLGLPSAGRWREVLNTDATVYNGTGIGNLGGVDATDEPWHGRPASAVLVLPPTSALWLEPEGA